MTVPKKRGGRAKGYFPKVAEARKVLTDEALELYRLYRTIIQAALDKGEFEVAADHTQWLIEHMPEDEESGTLVGTSVDKNREPDVQGGGPSIQIGLALGGMPSSQKALPTVTLVKPDKE